MSFKKLITWSLENFSELPWRENRSLYSTWISEVMLQQTTVYTVQSRLDEFIKKFPSVKALANATEEDLLSAWKGLGYYQRAKNLKKAAAMIHENFKGEFPKDLSELQSIPGIGPYTSSAIFSIGMDNKAIALDGNLERVLSRYYGLNTPKGEKLKAEINSLFSSKEILHEEKIKSWRALNEALMDLGRVFCQARKAECTLCPLRNGCEARKLEDPTILPVKPLKKKEEKTELPVIRYICEKDQKILVYRKPKGTWLAGQYELPTFRLQDIQEASKQYPLVRKKFKYEKLDSLKTTITKFKIQNYIKRISGDDFDNSSGHYEFRYLSEIMDKLSTASVKCLKKERENKPDSV